MKRVPLVLFALLALASIEPGGSVAADNPSEKTSDRPIYRYVDRNGSWVFTDDLSRIPAEFRSSAKVVELPPAVKIPEPPPPPKPAPPSLVTRTWKQFETWSMTDRVIFGVVIPMLLLSLWVLDYARKRSEGVLTRLLFRLGILGIFLISIYLCYLLLIWNHAEWLRWNHVDQLGNKLPAGKDLLMVPKEKAEELKKGEADRLKTIEGIADQK